MCFKMEILLKIAVLLFFNVSLVYMRSQQPVAEKVWREHCARNGLALNDCNWCKCDSKLQYVCSARICSNVDMFGHFNDAIKEVDVGMEGHGVWRTLDTACEPGVHYRKHDLLCVCTDEGKWPNPVCRDVFQVLHAVESTTYKKPCNQTCSPNKLYQVGCNVCYCPSTGLLSSKFCTKRNCTGDVVDADHIESKVNGTSKDNATNKDKDKGTEKDKDTNKATDNMIDEIYAACERAKKYQLGCKTCVCLPNNRLLCDNCTAVSNVTVKVQVKPTTNLCTGKAPRKRFKQDCNICYCDQKDIMYCTVYRCLEYNTNISLPDIQYETVDPPIDDNDCVPGTMYKRDCNLCHCYMQDGVKHFGCTLKKCQNSVAVTDSCGCVEGTKYEKNCLICQCFTLNGDKKEICVFNEKCRDANELDKWNDTYNSLEDTRTLSALHGYCEPLHTYQHGCNKCKCLTDGKTVACTSKDCSGSVTNLKSVVVEFIPFIQKQNVCPKGHKYKVNCNLCHCMSNGNALCTTNACKTGQTLKVTGDYLLVLFITRCRPRGTLSREN